MADADPGPASRAQGRERLHRRALDRRSPAARDLAPLFQADAGVIRMTARPETRPAVDDLQALDELTLHHRVSQFLYREARLQDTHDYQGWESLWEDDAIYWIPANGEDIDPEQKMSVIYDN